MDNVRNDEVRKAVRENYGKVAASTGEGCCCSSSSCCGSNNNPTPEEISMALDGEGTGFPGGIPGVETGRETGDLRCGRHGGNA